MSRIFFFQSNFQLSQKNYLVNKINQLKKWKINKIKLLLYISSEDSDLLSNYSKNDRMFCFYFKFHDDEDDNYVNLGTVSLLNLRLSFEAIISRPNVCENGSHSVCVWLERSSS